MQRDGPQTPKNRPRARTGGSFPNILRGRKSEPSPAAPTSPSSHDNPPAHLSLAALVQALTPPAVLSLSHARAIPNVLTKEPTDFVILTPVIARLCAPGVPSAFLAAGLDVISACVASVMNPPNDLERASLFSVIRLSDYNWAPETWKPRANCLLALTKDGGSVAGFGTEFLRFVEKCISSALQGLLSDDDSDRYMRETYIKCVSHILRKTLDQNAAFFTEQDFRDVLAFFDGCVQQSMTRSTGPPGSQPNTPVPATSPSLVSHRRNASSLGSPIPYVGSRQPPKESVSPLDLTVLPIQLYLDFLDMYRRQLSPGQAISVASALLCIVAVHINPLPHLSVLPIPQHRPRPTEEAALKHLFTLLSGPYSDTVAIHIKECLASDNWKEALGAFRCVRVILRDAAISRMALVALRRPRMDDYAPSGQPVFSEGFAEMLERAHREGLELPSFTLSRLRHFVGKAVHDWSARFDPEKVLEEALGMVKDILSETSDRAEDKESDENIFSFNVGEGRFIGTILSEAVKYVQRLRVSNKLPFLTIDKPLSAPTPLLMTLCSQLSLPLTIPITPNLPSILLSMTSCLNDSHTVPIPKTMHDLGLLTPTSPEWLDNISTLFASLVSRERPNSSREVINITNLIHSDLAGVPIYRQQLGQLVYEITERLDEPGQTAGLGVDGDESLFSTCTTELVSRMFESSFEDEDLVSSEKQQPEDEMSDLIRLFVRNTEGGCSCTVGVAGDENTGPLSPSHSQEGTPVTMTHPSSASGVTPTLSRVPSDFNILDSETAAPAPVASTSSSVLPPIMSIIPGWGLTRNRDREREREPDPPPVSPVTTRSEVEVPVPQSCRPSIASLSLVNAFLRVSFSAPPRAAHSVRLFKTILSVLGNVKCSRAKLTLLQLLMRLRADQDHRLYSLDNVDDEVHSLAVLLDRSRLGSRDNPLDDSEIHRARSFSRGLRRRPKSAAASRSRSRPTPPLPPVPPPRAKPREPLWMVPESIPFNVLNPKPSADGITTYETNAPTEWEDLKHWLPISDYMLALVDILRSESDWEILSYVLCHLPMQLANKHFFCGPKTKEGIVALLITLCTVIFRSDSWASIAEQLPDSLRLRDAQGVAYHTLAVLISYRRIFDERKHHDMLVEAFMTGLGSQHSAAKFCLNALSICAFEFPISITKNLPHILEAVTRIMTNASMAVHILDFVSIVGSLPSLYANFREQEFRKVFTVAVTYIHHHKSPDPPSQSGQESFALSQHVLVIAYYLIYVWFLAVPLPDRPIYVQFLTRRLLLANGVVEPNDPVDEPTEVCFDWLARYTYASADPKPTYSLLGDVVMNHPRDENNEPIETPSSSKTWIWGNSLVSVRTLPKRGWIEVESVRPSGETRFLCKLENFPQVNPGDVNPDRFSDPLIMMADRDARVMERSVPDPEESDQSRPSLTKDTGRRAREVFVSRGEPEASDGRPDSVSGYVWAQSAPSQRRKEVTLDPSFFAVQLSHYPHIPRDLKRSQLVPQSSRLDGLLRTLKVTPVIDTHKIAIVYVGPGQKTEREILGNRHGSPAYTRFLEGMGRLIRIRDQLDVYTGDIVPETDGEFTYAWWDDIVQVVYHTATLMPNLESDPAYIFKKRHVGNDKVRIVWNDSGLPYEHDTIASAFNLVNIIIQPHSLGTIAAFSSSMHEREFFKVTMQRMVGMPEFGPIGDYKLVSAESLAPLLRQVSLLADFFSEVYVATDKDTTRHEYVTNWRRRLQYINTFRTRWESEPHPELSDGPEGTRDFTRYF